jgi:hypothetical protein
MNISRVLLAGSAVLSIGLLAPLAALACEESSVYTGGGYTVSIREDGSYYGCNAKQQCLEISKYAYQSQGQYIWENKGTTYSMTPIRGKNNTYIYRLKVVNAQKKVLVNQKMKLSNN